MKTTEPTWQDEDAALEAALADAQDAYEQECAEIVAQTLPQELAEAEAIA